VTTYTPTVHTGILRCNEVLCVAFVNFRYTTPAEKAEVLSDNCKAPWRCPIHQRKGAK
jgi:hypothetical protein